jgi:hypothetical protein
MTSVYADDVVVHVAPIKEDILNLATILDEFGEFAGLRTNFQKSSEVPKRRGDLNLNLVNERIPATRTSFPARYLGLPLSVRCLKTEEG